MAPKKVYVCFDYENDKKLKFLLSAWNANSYFDFTFKDLSSREIQSDNISVVKANLTKKIMEANYTLVLAGKDINKLHKDYKAIGYKNWQNFEVARSVQNGNKIIVVRLPGCTQAPEECKGVPIIWVNQFIQEDIVDALNKAGY